jgi:nucleoside-diphosphate-sugar epimerase
MNIAITGATGFIGKYVTSYLVEKGYGIIALGRDIKKLNDTFGESVVKRETDFTFESLLKVLNGADAIIHLAGVRFQKLLDPLVITPYIDGNILLTQNLLKAAQVLSISRISQTSSIGVYSASNTLPFKETEAPYAITIYGVSKLTCENLANLFSSRTKIKVTNLRLASLCGVGEKEGVIFTDYINLARHKKAIEIWGRGETSLDFVYVKDVVLAIEKSILPNAPYGTYNIGSGKCFSVKEIAEAINNVFNNEGNIVYLTDKIEGGYKIYMDASKAQSELGWKPQWSLNDALLDMLNIYQKV